jgi:hypothetical protein
MSARETREPHEKISTAVAERSDDTAFPPSVCHTESGVALRFPPQSKTCGCDAVHSCSLVSIRGLE